MAAVRQHFAKRTGSMSIFNWAAKLAEQVTHRSATGLPYRAMPSCRRRIEARDPEDRRLFHDVVEKGEASSERKEGPAIPESGAADQTNAELATGTESKQFRDCAD